ncbi:zinc finger and SCAN domain-containing protein 29-like [Pelodiscus sinensis]|uniref:zinc finger and SCAN domain-containing protein 29-like n=1 Tax=Pelodiscus sinensis TaxID=13735 RepID=UPI003F6B0869
MSQPPDATHPSASPRDQPGGSQEPARGRKRRAPAWSSAEILDLIEVWGEASNVHDLRTSHRNAAVYSRMADSLAARCHQWTQEQVRCKIKVLWQSYSRACLPGADPEACPHFQALDRILGAHAVHAPRVVIDPGAEGPILDTEEEEPEDAESQEPAQDPGLPRNPTHHISCVVRGRGGLHLRSTWDCRAHHPACNSHPCPGQQACQE